MSKNILSKSRCKYITVKDFMMQYSLKKSQAYKLLAMPIFKDAIFKPSEKLIRINQDKAYEIMEQHFN